MPHIPLTVKFQDHEGYIHILQNKHWLNDLLKVKKQMHKKCI